MPIVTNLSKLRKPTISFEVICKHILPKNYDVSVVLVNNKTTKELNKKYRKKNKPTDVLSFPISENMGEIFINLELIDKIAKEKGQTKKTITTFLLIHSLLHLCGHKHGSIMENMERKLSKKFGCVSSI